eukprot:9898313-Alexandrium_andersonii.AAC.1
MSRAALGGQLPSVPRVNPSEPAEVDQPKAPSTDEAAFPQREPPLHPPGANHRQVGGPIASSERELPGGERAVRTCCRRVAP